MADIENAAMYMEGGVDDAYIPPALKFDFIYQYMTNVDWKYLAQIPSYKQPAYQLKRLWLLTANGYVPEWHCSFIPTKLGNSIVTNINRKVFSGVLLYERDKNAGVETEEQRKWFIDNYVGNDEVGFEDELERLSWNAMASGASIFVAKKHRNGNLYFDAYREDKYLPTFVGKQLRSVRLYSSEYNSLDGKDNPDIYVLEDYRFIYKGRAYSRLRAFRKGSGEINSIVDNDPNALTYEQMPPEVARAIKSKVGDRLNKVCPLPFKNGTSLGVKVLNNTKQSSYFDMPGYSDSILAPVIEQLFEYDRTYTTMINDIALGRGQVLIPDTMDVDLSRVGGGSNSMAMLAAALSQQNMLSSKVFRRVPVSNPESIKPESVQFEMRIQEHLESLRGQRINIFNGIGINPGALDPTLAEQGPQKTATQVQADEQNLVTFVQDKRKALSAVMNWAVDLVFDYYFNVKDCSIHPKFSSGNLSNALLVSQMAVDELNAGARSLESAVEKINPNASKEEIEKEVESIRADKAAMGMQEGGGSYFGDAFGG